MNGQSPVRIRARWLLSPPQEPVSGGVITLFGGRIVAVETDSGYDIDLVDCAICPALINAHTHLELSHHQAPVGEAGMSLPAWLKAVMESRRLDPSKDSKGTSSTYLSGIQELLASGTTTAVDIVQPTWNGECGPLRMFALHELRGYSLSRATEVAATADTFLQQSSSAALSDTSDVFSAENLHRGLSPHAPYSLSLSALERVTEDHSHRLMAMHLAESHEELEFLATGQGPFRELLQSLGAWDAGSWEHPRTIVDYLKPLSRVDKVLVIHGNYLNDEAIRFMAQSSERWSVVYCPRTHSYFGHDKYPWDKLKQAGLRVLLGTDSRASSPNLQLWDEIRAVRNVSPPALLAACTCEAAQAIGLGNQLGRLSPGYLADLVVLGGVPALESSCYEAILDDQAQVVATISRGGVVHSRTQRLPLGPIGIRNR